ncbi:MAG: DAK2 domain-containing protein [Anaerolineae bacterium]|nr:DAK2 domain-containing protein [Anaerolineae bacterium]
MSIETSNQPAPGSAAAGSNLTLNGQELKALLVAGMTWLKVHQQTVNSLNVFPVPDGDTGTNMLLTMQAAYNEVANSNEMNVGKMAHGIAQGALMGARGNSGVILSQLWRGFARALDSLDVMDADLFVRAMNEAKNTAYKGVVRPVEGTILTVAKDSAAAAEKARATTNDLLAILDQVIIDADASVKHTPELLPKLKQAGVVDSGGMGLYLIMEGMQRFIKDLPLEATVAMVQPLSAMVLDEVVEDIEPGQDYEVVVDFKPDAPLVLESFYNDLAEIGTSIQVGEGDGMYRMHIHVPLDKRYEPIDYIMTKGTITKVAMENLMAQMEDQARKADQEKLELAEVQPGEVALVVISPGPGISRIFASLGAAAIIEGGQTMNPSTEEILQAIENLPTDQIIILPNNKNIILAANNAAELSVKHIRVVPSRSVPQGISAIFRHNPEANLDELFEEMKNAISEVDTGEITIATRSVEIDDVKVQEGQVIALLNGQLVLSSAVIDEAVLYLLDKADTQDKERVTLFYGNNITKADVDRIGASIQEKYPDHEIEVHNGGQPYYQFIIAIE